MTDPAKPATAANGYLRFLAWAAVVAVAAGAIGFWPTRRLAGDDGVPALVAGCLVGFLSSALGGLPIALIRSRAPASRLLASMGAMGARLLAVVVLGAAAELSGWFASAPLLLWIAISYAALLGVDAWYALRTAQGAGQIGSKDFLETR
jgi:hypothetical protein